MMVRSDVMLFLDLRFRTFTPTNSSLIKYKFCNSEIYLFVFNTNKYGNVYPKLRKC